MDEKFIQKGADNAVVQLTYLSIDPAYWSSWKSAPSLLSSSAVSLCSLSGMALDIWL